MVSIEQLDKAIEALKGLKRERVQYEKMRDIDFWRKELGA